MKVGQVLDRGAVFQLATPARIIFLSSPDLRTMFQWIYPQKKYFSEESRKRGRQRGRQREKRRRVRKGNTEVFSLLCSLRGHTKSHNVKKSSAMGINSQIVITLIIYIYKIYQIYSSFYLCLFYNGGFQNF